MIVRILTIFTFLFCFSCDDDSRHLLSMLGKLTSHAKKEYKLDCIGSGFAAPNVIKEFLLDFEYPYKISYAEARTLIISLTEDFIKIAKTDPVILENLESATFTEDNLYYIIVFPSNGPEFTGISLSNGKIKFLAYNEPKLFFSVRIEPYNEAYSRVYDAELVRE